MHFTTRLRVAALALVAALCSPWAGLAQALKPMKASDLQLALQKMNVLGSVLYIAAHPDDENTRMIAYLAKHQKYETTYLSLTRGDGGQNLIGSELGYKLGIIRTQELLAARRIDGGKQLFSTANDFGFSKNPDETLRLWDKQQVLADVVWAIRKLRPDVMITRFPTDGSGGHGHHTTSSILAEEAFRAAADPNAFPEQLKYVQPWQAKRLLWNKWRPGFSDTAKIDETGLLKVDVGAFNPLLGESYADIAMDSRSQHKSQGFGAAKERGSRTDFLQHTLGQPAQKELFEGINTTWARIKGGEKVGKLLAEALEKFRPDSPHLILPTLVQAYTLMDKMNVEQADEKHWIAIKKDELKDIIRQCAGLWFEIVADDYSAVPGDSIGTKMTLIKRADVPATWRGYSLSFAEGSQTPNQAMPTNQPIGQNKKYLLPANLHITQPYWLRKPVNKGMYQVDDQLLVGLPETPSATTATWEVELYGQRFAYTVPMLYKWTHRVDGEQYRPFEITPEVTVNIKDLVYVFAGNQAKQVAVVLKAGKRKVGGSVSLDLPAGWRTEPSSIDFSIEQKDEEKTVYFQLFPPEGKSVVQFGVKVNGQQAHALERIDYPHIPIQTLFPLATSKAVKLDIVTRGTNIGYYEGAGDEIPASLEQIGYKVTLLNEDNFDNYDLSKFDAIITGIRAYNAKARLKFQHQKLMEYVHNGGTLVVQYNVSFGLVTNPIGPYPFRLSRDRVTEENAPVEMLDKAHPLFNSPNKIGDEDFEGWVQERGLYFADQWDAQYQPLLACADPGSKPLKGGLLLAKHGKGTFIYTGYAWFRQLPAGVPGAYRLFTNMISSGK